MPRRFCRTLAAAALGALSLGWLLGAVAHQTGPDGVAETSAAAPANSAPAPVEAAITAELQEALELYRFERWEEFLEASETGEDSEHIFVMQARIDAGEYTADQLFIRGDAAFSHAFQQRDGYGTRPRPTLQRVHAGAAGGLDSLSCDGCHALGGLDGAGTAAATAYYFGDGERVSSALLRNPPAVLGLGYVQQLAHEMSAELKAQRAGALRRARAQGRVVEVALQVQDIDFGRLRAHPDGRIDSRDVSGVDADLVIKPFGWKGHTASLRRFGERAARIHFGIQSHSLALAHRYDPDPGLLHGSLHWYDPDGDGKQRELEDGTLTALALYMALLETPLIIPPQDRRLRQRWARGSALFDQIGCSDCHRRSLTVRSEVWVERGDSGTGDGFRVHLRDDGQPPRAQAGEVMLFSDLRRHDMGASLADPRGTTDAIAPEMWLTRPLWGVAESPPYLHDGRAPTLPAAILAHDGEAAVQRASYAALSVHQQQDLLLFLLSLSRQPKLLVAR